MAKILPADANQPRGQLELQLPGDDYAVVERVSARARSIRIEVRPGGRVVLIYPRWVGRSEALRFLHERDAWVRAKLAELSARTGQREPPPGWRWDGSDQVLLRGERLPLRIEPARLRRAAVRFEAQRLVLFVPPEQLQQPRQMEAALRAALQQQARLDAARMLDAEAQALGVRYARLRINDPQTLWGSCNAGAVICLSWRLVMAPPPVFRYVVIHELCHLVHLDHSPRFWALVERQMPDHGQHKQWLRERGHELQEQLPRLRA